MSTENVEVCPNVETVNRDRLEAIIVELQTGFHEWHFLKKKALGMALHYGLLLLEWKKMAGRRKWQKEIRAKVTGADLRTCNRWKRIADNKGKVEDALARWPEIKWGVVNMLKYLSGKFDPASPDEIGKEADASVIDEPGMVPNFGPGGMEVLVLPIAQGGEATAEPP